MHYTIIDYQQKFSEKIAKPILHRLGAIEIIVQCNLLSMVTSISRNGKLSGSYFYRKMLHVNDSKDYKETDNIRQKRSGRAIVCIMQQVST